MVSKNLAKVKFQRVDVSLNKNGTTEEEIYAALGEPPTELDEEDVFYLEMQAGDIKVYESEDGEHSGATEAEEELGEFVKKKELSGFTKLKLAAKADKDKIKLAKVTELEKAYKLEAKQAVQAQKAFAAAKEKALKAKSREGDKAAEAFFRAEEKKEAIAKKEAERIAQLNHKLHMSKLASDEPTPELVYAKAMGAVPNLAVDVRDENVALYEWSESYWKLLTKHEGKKRAFEWLEAYYPNMAGNKLAGNAYESALFKVQALPPKPKESIIPLLNAWMFLTDEGDFLIRQPSRAWGITYNIKAKLEYKEGSTFYEPKALPKESRFYKYLVSSLPDDDERALVQEYCGYTLTNNVQHHVAQVWEGGGSNGKSVLLSLIEALHQNVVAVNLDKLDGPEMAEMRDASLAISAETPRGKLNENELKKFLAGDPVSLRNLYERSFTHRPTAKWIMSCNRFPRIQDDSDAVFRRLQYIRWNVKFSGKEIIKSLDKLIIENELNLVVDWCLEGLQRLTKRGDFDPPESVKARLQAEKIASNSVFAFVSEFGYKIDPTGFTIGKDELYKQYQDWCTTGNIALFGGNEFWKRMGSLFPDLKDPQKTIANKVRKRFVNLTLKTPEDLAAEQDEVNQAFNDQ